MDYKLHYAGSDAIVELHGRMTFNDHETFRSLTRSLSESTATRFVFDFQGLEFIDSSGLGMFLIAKEIADEKAARIALRNLHGQIEKVIKIARFDGLFQIE